MDIERFIARRQPIWNRLGELLDSVEVAPDREIGHRTTLEIVRLYRQTTSDLNRLRSWTANPEILGRLNQLAGRAYRFIYRDARRHTTRGFLGALLLREIPATFRREWFVVLATALALFLGVLVGSTAVILDPSNGPRLIPAEFFSESPAQRVERIEKGDERVDTLSKAAGFGASLYAHNIRVSLLAFSLGALTIIGAWWFVFYQGVILGAVGAMYVIDGVQVFFLAWVGPHGSLEIPAIVFAAAAGIKAGHALLMPGDLTRGDSMRRVFPTLWKMLLATALTLVLAGLVEGGFSQLSSNAVPYGLKITVAALIFVALVSYLFVGHDVPPADGEVKR